MPGSGTREIFKTISNVLLALFSHVADNQERSPARRTGHLGLSEVPVSSRNIDDKSRLGALTRSMLLDIACMITNSFL
jgi:hypothetical protein